jgi:hypothetical protein
VLIQEITMAAQDYLDDTKPAVSHLFEGLNAYDSIKFPSILQYIDNTGLVKMTRVENDAFLKAYEQSFDLEFARAVLAGSILQVAYMALKTYSADPGDISTYSKYGIQNGSTVGKFCLGRQVHGIPIGLLIYAGRVQYNHWEDGEPSHVVAKIVFRELIRAYYDDTNFDMAYELNYPTFRPVSHYIVRLELGWRTYEDYESDMRSLLNLV